MQARPALANVAAAVIAALQLATFPALAAPPADLNYLQNQLDGRGRCLGTAGDAVAMTACAKSPDQQWTMVKGDIPGYYKLQTMADHALCLSVDPANRRNEVKMAPCGAADNQQWYVQRLGEVPRQVRFTNRAIGHTRCLESQQTGLKLTSCGRDQPGHFWRADYLPTM